MPLVTKLELLTWTTKVVRIFQYDLVCPQKGKDYLLAKVDPHCSCYIEVKVLCNGVKIDHFYRSNKLKVILRAIMLYLIIKNDFSKFISFDFKIIYKNKG